MDAPDLVAPTPQKQPSEPASGNVTKRLNGNSHHSARPSSKRTGATMRSPTPSVLDSTASVALGDRLVAEIDAFNGLERATEWAQRSMAEKNRLLRADAHRVEDAFQVRLGRLSLSGAMPCAGAMRPARAAPQLSISPP